MLATLRIKNLALVDDLTVELRPGLNAVSGETGAGKSMLIGAIALILGERADRNAIRSGAEQCTVEAVFDISQLGPEIPRILEENGLEPCEEGQLILRRVIATSGTNRQFINGSPTSLQVLKTIGEELVDIHGPHDHQSLLHSARQLDIVDAFGGLESRREELAEHLRERNRLDREKAELIVDEQTYAQQLDLLQHQVHEIEQAGLEPGEDEQVEADYSRIQNAADILQLVQSAQTLLSEGDDALMERAGELGRVLHDLERLDSGAGTLDQNHRQAMECWRELQSELGRYADQVEMDPERLQQLEDRLNLIQSLKRKYGGSVEEVIEFGRSARSKLESLQSRDAELARIQSERDRIQSKLEKGALELSKARRALLKKLSKSIAAELHELGFSQSQFSIELDSEKEVSATGIDRCDFLFAPNVGEPPRPLRAIASSGEMARVMLALKTVLAVQDRMPVLIFDEVDANVGGETAEVVGRKMQEIGVRRQVLCITHLPAVAAAGHVHFAVRKELREGRTVSLIDELQGEDRVRELTRMLGGKSEAARKHAAALLKGK